jgi:two-component system NarL family response regulator
MADTKLKIMLVDDHYLVRMGLSSIIALERDMTICAEAPTGSQAIALYRTYRPDVTLMDLRMPGMSGLDATHAIRMEFPDARIIVLSTYVSDEEIYAALQAGAMAYLVKSVARDELIQAIRKAAAGRRHVPPEVADRLAERMSHATLSTRELDVLRLLVKGRRNREIASALDITEGTVKLHVSSILGKLEVTDRTEAATVALKRGLVGLDV